MASTQTKPLATAIESALSTSPEPAEGMLDEQTATEALGGEAGDEWWRGFSLGDFGALQQQPTYLPKSAIGSTIPLKWQYTGPSATPQASTVQYPFSQIQNLPPMVQELLNKVGPNQWHMALAALEDYARQMGVAEQRQTQVGKATEIQTEAYDKYMASLTEIEGQIQANLETSLGRLEEAKAASEQHHADVLARREESSGQLQAYLAETETKIEDLRAEDMEARVAAIDSSIENAKQQIIGQANALGDPKAATAAASAVARLEGQRRSLIQLEADKARISYNTTLAAIRDTGAKLIEDLAKAEDMYAGFSGQLLVNVAQQTAEMAANMEADAIQSQLGLVNLRMSGATAFADFIENRPIISVGMGGLLLTLGEIARQSAEEWQQGYSPVGAYGGTVTSPLGTMRSGLPPIDPVVQALFADQWRRMGAVMPPGNMYSPVPYRRMGTYGRPSTDARLTRKIQQLGG